MRMDLETIVVSTGATRFAWPDGRPGTTHGELLSRKLRSERTAPIFDLAWDLRGLTGSRSRECHARMVALRPISTAAAQQRRQERARAARAATEHRCRACQLPIDGVLNRRRLYHPACREARRAALADVRHAKRGAAA